jgi:hypothetical protein
MLGCALRRAVDQMLNVLYALLVHSVMAGKGIATEDIVEEDEHDERAQQVVRLQREGRESNLRWGQEHRSEVKPAKGVMDRHVHRSLI